MNYTHPSGKSWKLGLGTIIQTIASYLKNGETTSKKQLKTKRSQKLKRK
jgi:hypothetical protein